MAKRTKLNNVLIIALVLLGVMAMVILVGIFLPKPREVLQGQAETSDYRISSKVPSRVKELRVKSGDRVKAGDTLVIMDSPEVEAKMMQAEAAEAAAKAIEEKARNGARQQEIQGAYELWQKAQAGLEVAQKTFSRVSRLYDEGVIPAQKRDEAETQMKASQSAADAARAQYNQAVAGARSEDKAAANALVLQAKGATAEVDAYLEETKIRSPISGEVSLKLAEEGEVVGSGMPVIAVTDLDDAWAVFHLREDFLKNVSKGKKFSLHVPALDKNIDMEVSYIASVGDYATWRSSKESGGFDLKTFEVRLRPTEKVENLRPGMSVLLSVDAIK